MSTRMPSSVASAELTATAADWENCWEQILHLPINPLSNHYLFGKAKHLVLACRARNGYDAWFAWEISDAKLFVREQLDLDPGNPEWERIGIVLAGAEAGLIDEL